MIVQSESNGSLIVASVTFQKDGILVRFENQETALVDPETYASYFLYEGKKFEKAEKKAFLLRVQQQRIRSTLLNYLLRSPRSVEECRTFLFKKAFHEKEITTVLQTAKAEGLLNDQKYACLFAEDRQQQGYGKWRILADLKARGISESDREAIEFEETQELEKANRWIEDFQRKFQQKPFLQKQQACYQALLVKGFDAKIAAQAITQLKEEKSADFILLRETYDKIKCAYHGKPPTREEHKKIIQQLLRKGFSYDAIQQVVKEQENEIFE